jgi:hypothetical protein
MGELMRIERRSERVDQAGQFVSVKCGGAAIPVRHPLVRDALVQAALDPTIRLIEYLPAVQTAPAAMKVDAITIERNDGRYYLDVVEARPRRSIAQRLMVARALLDLGIRALVRTESDIMREPRCTNARSVWEYAGRPIEMGLRLQVLGALENEGAMTLGDLLSCLRSDRDPAPAVMAMSCLGLIDLDLVAAPIGPATLVRHRG